MRRGKATTFTAPICVARAVISAAVEAVVMGDIADLVIPVTVRMIFTHVRNTEPSLALVTSVTVRVHFTLAGVVSQVTDGGGVLTVKGVT